VRSVVAAVAALVALPLLVVVIVLGSISGPGAPGTPAAAVIPAAGAGGGTAATNQKLAARLAAGFGWSGQQLTCLDELWTRESGWSQTAINGSTGEPYDLSPSGQLCMIAVHGRSSPASG
jgi:hypothetical protein